MKYVVFACTSTKELFIEARNTGFEDVWIPMQRIRVMRKPRNRAPYYKDVDVCPVVGYIYVPAAQAKAFKAWCPEKYNIKAILVYMAPPGSSHLVHSALVKHATIELSELKEHEQAVKKQNKPAQRAEEVSAEPIKYKKGDKIMVQFGEGRIPATVEKVRANRLRVSCCLGFMEVTPEKVLKTGQNS